MNMCNMFAKHTHTYIDRVFAHAAATITSDAYGNIYEKADRERSRKLHGYIGDIWLMVVLTTTKNSNA